MDAFAEDKIERAIELYASCIIAERDFLAEPENGLIRKGIEYLKERPNRMPHGQFYRGLLFLSRVTLSSLFLICRPFLNKARQKRKRRILSSLPKPRVFLTVLPLKG